MEDLKPNSKAENAERTEGASSVEEIKELHTDNVQVAANKTKPNAPDNCDISQDMGASGTGFVNLSSGVLTYKFEDFVGTDATMPIIIAHVYKNTFAENYVGRRWRLNLQQEIASKNGYIVYTDKEGKDYTFHDGFKTKEGDGRSTIRNEELGMDLFKVNDFTFKLVDRGNNTLVFKENRMVYSLTEMHQYPSTPTKKIDAYSMQITYDANGRIATVTAGKAINGKRPKAIFHYGNYLDSIEYNLDGKVANVYYWYDDDVLSNIEKQNYNITEGYNVETQFAEVENKYFEVKDATSVDSQHNMKSLKYEFENGKVEKFSIGYGASNREESQIEYCGTFDGADDKTDDKNPRVIAATYIKHKNTVSAVSFNKSGVVSQFSYELQDSGDYKKLKKVLNASYEGFNYKSLANSYSDTLDIYHSDFVNSVVGWSSSDFLGVSETYSISGGKSLTGRLLNMSYTHETKETNGETLYISLWVFSDGDLTVKVNDDIARHFSKDLNGKWQFMAFPVGRLKNKDTITVTFESDRGFFIEDVRITKMPYETPDDIPKTELNDFGNVKKSYRYNPVDKEIYCTEYRYDENQQMTYQIVTVKNNLHGVTVFSYNTEGLLTDRIYYDKINEKYFNQKIGYDGYTPNAYIDEYDVKTKFSEGINYTQSELTGETNSHTQTVKNTYYESSNFLKTVSSGPCQNEMSYNAYGLLKTAKSGTQLNFGYDSFGNVNSVKIGSAELVKYNYDWKHLNSVTYANNSTISYTYDDKGRVTKITQSRTTPVRITYSDDAEDTVTIKNGNGVVYESKSVNKDGITGEYSVTFPNEIRAFKVQGCALKEAGGESTVKTYFGVETSPFEICTAKINGDGLLTSVQSSEHGANHTYTYDYFNRLDAKETKYECKSDGGVFKVSYIYKDYEDTEYNDKASPQVIHDSLNYGTTQLDNYRYEYYNNGNIKAIYSGHDLVARYEYDEHNRLKREDNYGFNRTSVYVYDNNGNIAEKRRCNLTDGEIGENYLPYVYKYSEGSWKDQLVSYVGQTIEYDALGNPTNYCGKTMQWRGRRLINYNNVAMEYDYNGLRLRKGNKKYFWHGNTLKAECWEEDGLKHYIYFYYDESGVCGMLYHNLEYHFRKNVFGDIVAIYDAYGYKVCSYVYDAWGKHKISGVNQTIGRINPFRYRGYYYDEEFGLYYLQNRYYDPEVGRFISADDVSYLNPQSIFGLNLYAYCNNNPVMYIDPSGRFAWLIAIALGVLLFTPIGGVATQVAASVGGYVGIAISAIWDKDVRSDMNAIHWNPFNSDGAVAAKSKKASFYKGVPVLRISGMGGSMSMGAIFLDIDHGESELKHERGHNTQLMSMGLGNYLIQIGIPSMWKNDKYSPWELSASMLGGSGMVSGSTQEQQDAAKNYFYWSLVPIANLYNVYKYIFVY